MSLNLENVAPAFPYIGPLLGVAAVWFSLRACKRQRLIDTLPTSKVQGVFIGLVELNGTAETDQPIASFLTGLACVYYSYKIEEKWSRTVTAEEFDKDGNMQTVTRRESGWTTIAQATYSTPFYLKDDTGLILIQPEGAEFDAELTLDQLCTPIDALYFDKGPAVSIPDSDSERRFTERVVRQHAQVFVVGQARERADKVEPEIAADPQAEMFLISVRTEKDVASSYRWHFWGLGIFSVALAAAGCWTRDAAIHYRETTDPYVYAALASTFLFAWFVGWMIVVYNSLVTLHQRVRQGWAQVDVQLKRRHDLIPNLVSIVQGYKQYETGTQTELAHLRGQLEATPPGQPGFDYEAVAPQIIAIAERYPDLKASESFLSLQKNLADTETRVALARSYFNDIATFYNTRLEIVPDRWIAAFGAFQSETLMSANGFEREPVSISLSSFK